MLSDQEIIANLRHVRDRVERAIAESDQPEREVRLLLATKTVPVDRIAVAINAGERLIGENRVQELAQKDTGLRSMPCERHFIGHLQTNKVNQVLRYVTCIQSVDRLEVADRVQRRLEALDETIDILLQVNVSNESSKAGVRPNDALTMAREIAKRDRLRLRGLMTIGLPSTDPELVRPGYRMLRNLRDQIENATIDGVGMSTLSMGMSGDLEFAIAEGATMVRVGSAVFGTRPNP